MIWHQIKGDKICLANQARSGYGTYTRDGYIYAALLGKAKLERELQTQSNDKSANASLPLVSIKTPKDNSVVIPHIGSLVIAKVRKNSIVYKFKFFNFKCLILDN